ncbi:MAG TPA: tagaturonate reductase [Calditrichia bacterium]|nr:tagaturonate reductase [Calditrichia bacterium]
MFPPILNAERLGQLREKGGSAAALPPEAVSRFPEKILQFGSGAFLRGFFDFYVDQANREGHYRGRIAVVQSTGGGRANIFKEQDGLFTNVVQGLRNGEAVEELTVNASVSRALSAGEEWPQVLSLAENPELEIAISNTTEVGIALDQQDRPDLNPPRSFPGKLTAVLYHRFRTFRGDTTKGLVVLPCELLENNGLLLGEIVLKLAEIWQLGREFQEWVLHANYFCNTLVDRIVPGSPAPDLLPALEEKAGYRDGLMTTAEVYSLYAIQGGETVRDKLAFLLKNPAVIVAKDISPYRERKLRLLNGSHTISIPLAFLSGHQYVIDMMRDPRLSAFVARLMQEEIAPVLDMPAAVVNAYAEEVLSRFANPFLRHQLIDISMQSTTKMRHRVMQTIDKYHQKFGEAPPRFALGFAAYLLFMRGINRENGVYLGRRGDQFYPIRDQHAGYFAELWKLADQDDPNSVRELAESACGNKLLWGKDLNLMGNFGELVAAHLWQMLHEGVESLLEKA